MVEPIAPSRPEEAVREVSHVFLDVGGTLLRAEPGAEDIFHRVLASRGHRVDRSAVVRLLRAPEMVVSLIRPLGEDRAAEFYRSVNARVLEHLGFESDDAMLDDIHAQFSRPLAWHPYPDAIETLRTLRAKGYRIGVISNASHELPETLRRTGLAPFLDTITYSFEVGAEKPHPKIFLAAVARAGTTPERAVHVGDSFETDYLGARQAGLHAIVVCRGEDPPIPCPHIRSLDGLPALLERSRSHH